MAKILLVDDDPEMRGYIELLLKQEGHISQSCSNAPDAIETLKSSADVELAILDVWLGLESGLDLCDALRKIMPDLPVIFVSGGGGAMSMEITTALADLKGQNRFLYKPFKKHDLMSAIKAIT